jgi:glycosyltransferase involved in cell wall biosynthesis
VNVQGFTSALEPVQTAVSLELPRPIISVVLPAHGSCPHIKEAIESLRTESSWIREVIVADDRMTPSARNAVEAIAASWPVVRIVEARGTGLVAALNTGLGVAEGEYLARMDADDIVVAGRFARQLEIILGKQDCLAVGGQLQYISETGSGQGASAYPTDFAAVARSLDTWCAVAHPAALIRTTALIGVGGYRELFVDSVTGASLAEDYDLWLRLRRRGAIANAHDIVLQYRQHDKQLSAENAATAKLAALGVRMIDCLDEEGRRFDIFHPIRLTPLDSLPIPLEKWRGSRKCLHLVRRFRADSYVTSAAAKPFLHGCAYLLWKCAVDPRSSFAIIHASAQALRKRVC